MSEFMDEIFKEQFNALLNNLRLYHAYDKWNDEEHAKAFHEMAFKIIHLPNLKNFYRCQLEDDFLGGGYGVYKYMIEQIIRHDPEGKLNFSGQSAAQLEPLLDIFWRDIRRKTYGWVYILQNMDEPELYKIGRSKRPFQRIKNLGRGGLAYKPTVELVHLMRCDNMSAAEKHIHLKWKEWRVHHEWFELEWEHVEFFKSINYIDD